MHRAAIQGRGVIDFGNNGKTATISPSQFADNQKLIAKQAYRGNTNPHNYYNNGSNITRDLQKFNDEASKEKKMQGNAEFMQQMAIMAGNRGVNKQLSSPAQQNGVTPTVPQLFGVQPKQPVQYQKIINNQANLSAVLKGFQEQTQTGGGSALDTANILVNLQRDSGMMQQAQNKQLRTSIYAGVPKVAQENLFNIKLNNQRRDSIYALI